MFSSSMAVHRPALAAGQHVAAARQQPQRGSRLCRPAAAMAPAASGGSSGRSAEELAAAVAEKEQQLQSMFEPGRIPKAGTVAALRKELAHLRSELQTQLGIGGSAPARRAPAPSAFRAAPSAPLVTTTAFPRATSTIVDSMTSAGGSGMASSSRVLDALKLVEAQLSSSRDVGAAGSLAGLTYEQQQELLALQEENTSLKAHLDFVLARQAQLQQVWDEHAAATGAVASSSVHSAFNGAVNGAGQINGSSSASANGAAAAAAQPVAVA